MAVFVVMLMDEGQLAGLSAARSAYNAHPELDENGMPIRYETNAAYVQFLVSRVAEEFSDMGRA